MRSKIAEKIINETPQEVRDAVRAYGDSVVRKEELRKEFLDYMNSYGNDTIEQSDNREFNWWISKLEAKDKEIAELNVQAGQLKVEKRLLENEIADLKAKLEAAENVIKNNFGVQSNIQGYVAGLLAEIERMKQFYEASNDTRKEEDWI